MRLLEEAGSFHTPPAPKPGSLPPPGRARSDSLGDRRGADQPSEIKEQAHWGPERPLSTIATGGMGAKWGDSM